MHDVTIRDEGAAVVSLIEFQAPAMTPDQARKLAEETTAALRAVPGLRGITFFGDFETGTHCYLQTWESRAALDAFMASESMFRIREVAAPYVTDRPTRRIFVDYTP